MIQCTSPSIVRSKRSLAAALNADPSLVRFHNSTLRAARSFCGADIRPGESFECRINPGLTLLSQQTATIRRKVDGTFHVG